MKIYIVIPLYNEEKHIANVLRSLNNYGLPVIVVDDGSKDNSGREVRSLKSKNLTLLEHRINLGKGAALKTGTEYAFEHGADAVIFIDSDGQHNPDDLGKFIKALESKKYDVVFGSRNFNLGVPLVRFLGNKLASVFIALLFKIYISDVICGFRALTKEGYAKIKWESAGYGVETETVARVGKRNLRYKEVPVETIYHDKTKGVTILDAIGIFGDVIKWKITL